MNNFETRRRIAERLMELRPRCGHCNHWMVKTICPPESRGEFVSAGRFTCPSFDEVAWVQRARDVAFDELLGSSNQKSGPGRSALEVR